MSTCIYTPTSHGVSINISKDHTHRFNIPNYISLSLSPILVLASCSCSDFAFQLKWLAR